MLSKFIDKQLQLNKAEAISDLFTVTKQKIKK